MSQDVKNLLPEITDDHWPIDWMKECCQGCCRLKQTTRAASFGKVEIDLIIWVASTNKCFYEIEVSSVSRCQEKGLVLNPDDGVWWAYDQYDLAQALQDYHSLCKVVRILISQEGGSE